MTSDGADAARPYFMRSERLGFATWREADSALAAGLWGDPAVTRFTGGPFPPDQVSARLAAEIANLTRHGVQYWPLFRLDTAAPVGCCGLRPRVGESDVFELGFQLRRECWGRRYAAEAARRVIDWAGARGVRALIAGHHPDNHPSRATLLRLGFLYTHHEIYPPTGQMEPCYRLTLERQPGAAAPAEAPFR